MEEVPVEAAVEWDGVAPPELMAFWRQYNVPAELLPAADVAREEARFFRVTAKGRENAKATAAGLALLKAQPVAALPGFHSVSASVGLSSTELYEKGCIMGCDLSSGAALQRGLGVHPGHHVLDLCCAPGVKMLMLSELVGTDGSVTGVDSNEIRMNVTRNVLRKYAATRVRLFLASGVGFPFLAPPTADEQVLEGAVAIAQGRAVHSYEPTARRVFRNAEVTPLPPLPGSFPPSAVAPEAVRAKKKHRFDLPGLVWASDHHLSFASYGLYDRVLVDAECTSDGAFRHHIVRAAAERVLREEERARGFVRTYRTDAEVMETARLQFGLLESAWHLVKPGGLILYCTCSLLRVQNEQVVENLLDRYPTAMLEPFDQIENLPHIRSNLKHAVYFRGGNSLFASRIRKPK